MISTELTGPGVSHRRGAVARRGPLRDAHHHRARRGPRGVPGAAGVGARSLRAVVVVPELRHARHPALANRAAGGRSPGGIRRRPARSGSSRERDDRRQGPGDQAERHLAALGVPPSAGRSRRRGPDGDRLRDQVRHWQASMPARKGRFKPGRER